MGQHHRKDTQHQAIHQALELAKSAQIATNFRLQVYGLAAWAGPKVTRLFPGPFGAIYLLTEPTRRHVWNAFLSRKGNNADLAREPEGLRQHLLNAPSHTLVAEAFGTCPAGYLSVLKRLPDQAAPISLYEELHRLLTEHPQLAMPLCNVRCLSHGLVTLLHTLPDSLRTVTLAEGFKSPEGYQHFLAAYRRLTGSGSLDPKVVQQLKAGVKPARLINELYEQAPLPAPALPNTDRIRHLGTVRALLTAARDFQNCLGNWITEAHRNERQYYLARLTDGTSAVLEIKNDAPAGWRFGDLKAKSNEDVAGHLCEELLAYLSGFGIHQGNSVYRMVKRAQAVCGGNPDLEYFSLDDL